MGRGRAGQEGEGRCLQTLGLSQEEMLSQEASACPWARCQNRRGPKGVGVGWGGWGEGLYPSGESDLVPRRTQCL